MSLQAKLSLKKVSPVYFLHGEETFLIDRFVENVKSLILAGPMADFNYCRRKAGEVTGAELVAEARSMPMMASRRLIVVDEADRFRVADLECLTVYLDRPVPETCLVLIGRKFDLRRGVFRKANGLQWVHSADPLKEAGVSAFIRSRADQLSVAITDGGVAAMADAVGPDCAALSDAIERTALYAGGGDVEAAHVEAVVSRVQRQTVFDLVDALGNRRAHDVMRLLIGLLSSREEPIRINAMLARHVRQLLMVRIYRRSRMESRQMASVIGVPPFVIGKLMKQADGFTGPQLELVLRRIAEVDFSLKSSRRPAARILEEALLDICG